MFEIRIICREAETDTVISALGKAFSFDGYAQRPARGSGRVRLYLQAVPHARPGAHWPTPEQAYKNAPSTICEIGWTCQRARSYAHQTGVDREFWLRKAAVLDRVALADGINDADELALKAARRLLSIDTKYEGVPGAPDYESPENLRGYVRQEYAYWAHTHTTHIREGE
ncbi:hypothetical protein [Streptomyces sp. NPDC029674]|uniref:hypothetical protein n=1 Tax=Streptomyces sp. NPDC029674 TaxID=3365297 RepID=UPI00384CDCC6